MSDDYADFNKPITELVARWRPRRLSFRQRFPTFRARRRYLQQERQREAEKRQRERNEQQKRDQYRRRVKVCACGYVIKDNGAICAQCRYNMRERAFRDAEIGDIIRWERRRYLKTATHCRRLCRRGSCMNPAVVEELCDEHMPRVTLSPEFKQAVDALCPLYDCGCDDHIYPYKVVHNCLQYVAPTLIRWLKTGVIVFDRVDDDVVFRYAKFVDNDTACAYQYGRGLLYTRSRHTMCINYYRWSRYRRRRCCDRVVLYTEIMRLFVAIKHGMSHDSVLVRSR